MEKEQIDTVLCEVRAALESENIARAIEALSALDPADQAEAISDLQPSDKVELIAALEPDTTAEILEMLPDPEAAQIAAEMAPSDLAEVLDEMEPKDAADILGDLPAEQAKSTLAEMEEAHDVTPLLKYPDDTAGGRMNPPDITLDSRHTAEQAIEYLRTLNRDTKTPYYLYVTDERRILRGVIGLRDLITAAPLTSIESIMNQEVISIPASADQESAVELMHRYSLLLLPVVDVEKRLIGIIRSTDIAEVIEQETTEDIYRLAGVTSDGQLQAWSSVGESVRRRLPWLYINLGTAFLAACVVSLFESTIAKFALLAVFQGVIAGQGGNAGTQTLAIMVRGLAVGEVQIRHLRRALAREAFIGLIHGISVGIFVGLGAWMWKGNATLGIIAALAMVGNMIAAGLAGSLVPLTLRALRLDPALASAVLVTTVTDCVGFGLFLGLATLFSAHL